MNTGKVSSKDSKSVALALGALLASGIAVAAKVTSTANDELIRRSAPPPLHTTHPARPTPPPRPTPVRSRSNIPAAPAARPQANMPRTPAANLQHLPGAANQRATYQTPGASRPVPGVATNRSTGHVGENAHPVSPTYVTSVRDIETRHSVASGGESRVANGSVIRTRADGSRAEIHDLQRGVDIHYGSNGARRIVQERSDHSRVFAERGGGYVQHPYMFRGQELAHRTYSEHGHEFAHFYSRNVYHGVPLEVYAPVRFYSVGFYGWAHTPWPVSVHYTWEWRGSPWYRAYGHYFAPYPVYDNGTYWLTDYLIATSLEAAYAAQVRAQMAAGDAPTLSPDVKAAIADEVGFELQQEAAAARANAADPQELPDNGGISTLLTDGNSHVFVAGSNLDIAGGSGNECTLSAGDVVQVRAAPAPGAQVINATVLASKGGNECAPGMTVRVALPELQEMQNYMHQTVDQAMADLQGRQGTGNLPAAPASAQGAPVSAGFAVGAPPPDTNAQVEINAQAAVADQAERDAIVANAQ